MRTIFTIIGALVFVLFILPLIISMGVAILGPLLRIAVIAGFIWVIWRVFFKKE